MATCGNCGTNHDSKFCPSCGAPALQQQAQPQPQQAQQTDFTAKLKELNNTADTTAEYTAEDINQNKTMAILAYFGPLVLIPIFAAKGSKYARFHSNQGLVLFLALIAYNIIEGILSSILLAISWSLYFLTTILGLVSIVFAVLAIIGIINASKGKAKELPVIGKIKLLK